MEENFDNILGKLTQHSEHKELKPEQKSDLIMSAQLSELVGDYSNAAILYKKVGEAQLVEQNKDLATNTAIRKVSSEINPHLEKIVKKIARWLTVRQQWNTPEQQKAFKNLTSIEHDPKYAAHKDPNRVKYIDAHIKYDSFKLTNEDPDYKALLLEVMDEEAGDYNRLEQMIQKQLGVRKVRVKKMTDHPYEKVRSGLELTTYGDNSLILMGTDVEVWKTDLLIEDKN